MSGIVGSGRQLALALLDLLLTRSECAVIELSRQSGVVGRWIIGVLGAAVLALLAGIAVSAALVLLLWPIAGVLTLLAMALVYAIAAVLLVLWVRAGVRDVPPLLHQTLQDLKGDRDALFGRDALVPDRSQRAPGAPGVTPK